VKIVDDRKKNCCPMPIDASGQVDVLIGRRPGARRTTFTGPASENLHKTGHRTRSLE